MISTDSWITLNNLLSEIEKLQERRYYPAAEKVYGTAPEAAVSEDVEAGDEELEMIGKRGAILSRRREKLLEKVLDIAKNSHGDLRNALKS